MAATSVAADALSHLRSGGDRILDATEEPVTTAFQRLREEVRPLTRHRDIDVQFVEPAVDGRPLPSEVAYGARAVVRGSILALVDRPDVGRVRVQWDCDGTYLLIEMRDDGRGTVDAASTPFELVRRHVRALAGRMTPHATPDWGAEMSMVIPLDPPVPSTGGLAAIDLCPRELDVLRTLAMGLRNREIAERLSISENTVKFHIASIYRKAGVHSRAEAVARYYAIAGAAADIGVGTR